MPRIVIIAPEGEFVVAVGFEERRVLSEVTPAMQRQVDDLRDVTYLDWSTGTMPKPVVSALARARPLV